MERITLALASKPFVNGDTQANLHTMLSAMADAARQGAALVCFGEAFLQGFDGLTWQWERDKDIAVSRTDEAILRLCAASRELGVDVAFGYIERDGERLYSSYMLIQQGEIHHNFRRISRGWKEYTITDAHYCEGSRTEVFDYRGRKMTVALCGDLWDRRDAFCIGAEVLLWPIYCDYSLDAWRGGTEAEYAQQCCGVAPTTCMINAICPPFGHGGCWQFAGGSVLRRLEPGCEGLLLTEV